MFYASPLRRLPALALLLFCLHGTAHAATLNVPAQYVTIQAGVNAAVDGDTVLVADGTYTGGGNRDIDFNGKNITVQSVNGPTKTIIDCGGFASTDESGNHRGFYIHGSETNAVIDGFTVKNGYTKYVQTVGSSGSGGGIYVASPSNIRVTDCTVTGNTASTIGGSGVGDGHGYGGGIFLGSYGSAGGGILVTHCLVTHCAAVEGNPNYDYHNSALGGGIYLYNDASGVVTMTGCTVTGNTADGGGGVFCKNYLYSSGSINVTDCTVSGNTGHLYGGGLFNLNRSDSSCTISVTHCTVNGNTVPSGNGGGIYNNNDYNVSGGVIDTILVTDCMVNNNTAPSGGGGGIYSESYAQTLTRMSGCMVNGNTASYGGGIYNANYSDTYFDEDGNTTFGRPSLVQMIGCAVGGNTASYDGGGVYNIDEAQGVLQMTNCTVSTNTAAKSGGGIYNYNYSTSTYDDDDNIVPAGGISVTACTISANTAIHGGGMENTIIYLVAIANVTDCIVYNNLHGEVSNVAAAYVAKNIAVDHSDVQGGHNGIRNLDADPLFVDAAGGNFHLEANSPVIGKGIAEESVPADKDGKARPDPPSLGAYEYAAALPAPTLISLSPASKMAGSNAFTLTVNGMGFQSNSVVHWNGDVLATTYISPTKLTAFVSASRLHQAGTAQITVTSPSAVTSGGKAFFISPAHIGIATGIATGPDGKTRILWANTNGTATVWTLNADGSVASYGSTYGPRAGWTAIALTVGPDNSSHILWTHADGRMSVWTVPADGSKPTYGPVYGPYAGWTATSMASDFYGYDHILWNNTNGAMTLWILTSYSSPTYSPVFGPFSGWTAKAISADGRSDHVLWTNTNGVMTLWTFVANGTVSYGPYYGPYAGWTATSIASDANYDTYDPHVLWHNTSGAMTLWTVPASGSPTYSPVFGPYAGYSAVGLSVDTVGNSHVLWDNADGRMTPWTLDASNQFVGTFPVYGPY